MFGFLKKKIDGAVKSISEKLGGKDREEKKEKIKDVEEAPKVVKKEKQKPVRSKPQKEAVEEAKTKTEEPEEIEEKAPEITEEKGEIKKEEKLSFRERLTRAVTEKKLSEGEVNEALWDLEVALLSNNVAEEVTRKIMGDLRTRLVGSSVKRSDAEKIISETLKKSVLEILGQPKVELEKLLSKKKPATIIFIGFNGSGKTTSVAKFANYLMKKKHSVVLAAGDSFRAAAIEQLTKHAERLNVPVIKHKYGADPAAVIFDAIKHAEARKIDVVLADTAGRTHTDANLVRELEKIVRVNKPDLKILVVESIAGNDVLEQAKVFQSVGIDGVILTKWDVDEKGGAALNLSYALKKPILFLGTGQEYGDFEEFDAKKAVDNIV